MKMSNDLGWSKYFSRAPNDPEKCIEACYYGCYERVPDDD